MILLDLLQLVVVSHSNLRVDLLEIALLGLFPDLFPVCLAVPFDRLGPELPRTIDTSLLFGAICIRPIVDLDLLEMTLRTVLLEG